MFSFLDHSGLFDVAPFLIFNFLIKFGAVCNFFFLSDLCTSCSGCKAELVLPSAIYAQTRVLMI